MPTLQELYDQHNYHREELGALELQIASAESAMRKSTTVTKRDASYVLENNGLAITFSKNFNSHSERHVYWYVDGKRGKKRGEVAIKHCRAGVNHLRLWLARQAEK